MIEAKQTEEFYKNEIRKILSEVKESFKGKQKNNYDLLELYDEVRVDFETIESERESVHGVVDIYERAKQLL
ncbi:hypothetical protein bcere0007_3400 [Bacillus mycoides]|uniref:hypothetical protein n=1 Tax=Bacillus mycoides TaxID=1405 RepID=UPI0001A0413D|nr:hypothetical protein [Bacillus mycoides]EEK75214.1 hypothetical protein bcere0007_3400 [Bacillus mycoides]